MPAHSEQTPGWTVPLIPSSALSGEGVGAICEAITAHQSWLRESGELRQREIGRARAEFNQLVSAELLRRLSASLDQVQIASLIARIVDRELAPHQAVNELLRNTKPGNARGNNGEGS